MKKTRWKSICKILNKTSKALILIAILALAVVPLVDFILLAKNNLTWASLNWQDLPALGQMGDFFGGHTSAFSGLISVALIFYFSIKQQEIQRKQFKEQLLISKQSADLTSLSTIYNHYGETYGSGKPTERLLNAIAQGHRRWVIRESFSIIDPDSALESHRRAQVEKEHKELVDLLKTQESATKHIERVCQLTSSLLLDKRLDSEQRSQLWELYEVLRENNPNIEHLDSLSNMDLNSARLKALNAK